MDTLVKGALILCFIASCVGVFIFCIIWHEEGFKYACQVTYHYQIRPMFPHIKIRRLLRKGGVVRHDTKGIRVQPAWGGYVGNYEYTARTLFGLLCRMGWYYKDKRFLVK